MSLTIEIPSKTFLVGEYNILNGGDSILITSKPYFKFHLEKLSKAQQLIQPFHKNSPSARFILDNLNTFKDYSISFNNQHNSYGGFGASGAQFLGCYLAKQFLINGKLSIHDICPNTLLKTFWKYCSEQVQPSGGDIISQLYGPITLFNSHNVNIQTMEWKFAELGFYLIPTHHKLPTHQHLENLNICFDKDFDQTVKNVRIAINDQNCRNFIEQVNIFNNMLLSKKLVTENTIKLLKLTKKCSAILTAKGCGALGADVILIIFNKLDQKTVSEFLIKNNLHILASDHDTVSSVKIRYNDQN